MSANIFHVLFLGAKRTTVFHRATPDGHCFSSGPLSNSCHLLWVETTFHVRLFTSSGVGIAGGKKTAAFICFHSDEQYNILFAKTNSYLHSISQSSSSLHRRDMVLKQITAAFHHFSANTSYLPVMICGSTHLISREHKPAIGGIMQHHGNMSLHFSSICFSKEIQPVFDKTCVYACRDEWVMVFCSHMLIITECDELLLHILFCSTHH